MAKNFLFLVDAHALCYRSFFAIRDLATSKGQPTNAVYGFINTLRKIIRIYEPEYIAVCFDSKEKTYRAKKFDKYKIHRPVMPDPLISQIPIIKELVRAYNIPIFELGGFEADDIIATLSKQGTEKGIEVVIVSEDKDMYQLVNDKVKMFSVKSDEILGYNAIKEKLGFEPKYMTDYIALAGDQSDNIPGIRGVGGITAKKLITKYETIDNIYKHIDEIESLKLREKLIEEKESAFLSRELALLESEVPFSLELDQIKVEKPDNKKLFEMFNDLEFKKFAQEIVVSEKIYHPAKVNKIHDNQGLELLVNTVVENREFAFLFDILQEEQLDKTDSIYISAGNEIFEIDLKFLKDISKIFNDDNIFKITYDLKKSLRIFSAYGVEVNKKFFDIMIAGYVLSPTAQFFELSNLIWNFLKFAVVEEEKNIICTQMLLKLYPILLNELKQKAIYDLYEKIEIPLTFVLADMESFGVNIDLKLLSKLSKECDKRIKQLTDEIFSLSGEIFNLNSPKQLCVILFEKLKLPVLKKTKTGFSTNEEVLVKLAKKHKVPQLILEYRQLAKLKSTYIDALPRQIDKKTGRVHTEFIQNGTETGRLSSRNPNLQNIPIRTELGKEIRKAFIPLDCDVLIAADYSQIELRVLAHLSQDENLINAFKNDEDIHRFTASLIFEIDEKDVTSKMRDAAKRVNFGIIYGISSYGLSKDLDISPSEAQDFIDKYFIRYPKVKEFIDRTIESCEAKGYVETLLYRRRYLPEINSKNMTIRQFAQRQAINTPVQGTAADLIKLSMIKIHEEIIKRKLKSRMLITVHDELVFSVPKNEEEEVKCLIKDLMENSLKLSVPIKATIKTASNWMDGKL